MTQSQKEQLKNLIAQQMAAVDSLAFFEARYPEGFATVLQDDVNRSSKAVSNFIDQM